MFGKFSKTTDDELSGLSEKTSTKRLLIFLNGVQTGLVCLKQDVLNTSIKNV